MPGLLQLGLVFAGGGLGAAARYVVGYWGAAQGGLGRYGATLFVNILGAFLLGALNGRAAGGGLTPQYAQYLPALTAGFCGGFTTFSTLTADAEALRTTRSLAWGWGYAAASVALGWPAYWLGLRMGSGR